MRRFAVSTWLLVSLLCAHLSSAQDGSEVIPGQPWADDGTTTFTTGTGDVDIRDASPSVCLNPDTGTSWCWHLDPGGSPFWLMNGSDRPLLVDANNNLYLSSLLSCDTIDTNSEGRLICGSDGGEAGSGDITDVNEGTAIDVTSPTGPAPSVAWDSTEVEATTWGAGGNASNAWTFNLSGTDPALTASSNTLTVTGDLAVSGIAGPDVTWVPTSGNTMHAGAEVAGANTVWFLSNATSGQHYLRAYGTTLELPTLAGTADCDVKALLGGQLYCGTDATSAGGGNSFETLSVPAGTNPVADASTDTLTITETSFLTITGTASTDTIDITQVTTDLGTDGLIAANAVALTTDTTGNYAAGDAEAGAALSGDSATSFFSTGTLEVGIGGTGATTLTDGGILLGSGTGAITALGVATNGQIPIGDGTTDPVLATLTGTANQVTVTNGAGTITLSTPQDVATTSSPTFADITSADASPSYVLDPATGDTAHIGLDPGGNPLLISNATDSRNLLILNTETGQVEIPHLSAAACDVKGTAGTGALYCGTDATGAGGGDSVSVDGVAVTDPNFASTGDIDFVDTANTVTANVNSNAVALGPDTTNPYVATVADAGNATITVVGSGGETAAVTLDAVDLNCTDCIGTTEIADSYVLNTGDTMTGDLALTGTGPDATLTPTSGDAAGMHAELFGASDTDFFLKNDTRFILEEWPNGLVLGGNSAGASAVRVWIKATTTGNEGLRLQDDSIGVLELDTADDPANNEVLTYQASSGRMVWGSGGSPNSFETLAVSGQSDVVADSATDTLTLTAGTNITLTTNAATDAVTIAATGGAGDSITVNSSAATDPDFLNLSTGITWTLAGGNSITAALAEDPVIAGASPSIQFQTTTGDDYHLGVDPSSSVLLLSNATSGAHILEVGGDDTMYLADAGVPNLFIRAPVRSRAVNWSFEEIGTTTYTGVSEVNYGDGTLLDLSENNMNTPNEGLKLGQAASVTSATAEGQMSWDTDDDRLFVGTGTAVVSTEAFAILAYDPTGITQNFWCAGGGIAAGCSVTEDNVEMITPSAITCTAIAARVDTAPAGAAAWNVALRDDGANTTLDCDISGAATTCTGTDPGVAIAAGSVINLMFTETGVATSTAGEAVSVKCRFD